MKEVFPPAILLAAALAATTAGCIYLGGPAGESLQANGTLVNFTNNSFLLKITFPSGAGAQNVSRVLEAGSCRYAFDCMSELANLSCAWYDAAGALACPNVTRTCFITSVDGVSPSWGGAGGYWTLLVNGKPSPVGVSCYPPRPNDELELTLTNNPI